MNTYVPEKSEDMFTNHSRKKAPEGLIKMFLQHEENARKLETKTGRDTGGTFLVPPRPI